MEAAKRKGSPRESFVSKPSNPVDANSGGMIVDIDIEQVEVGFVVNLDTFREVLKGLSINGRRWWIASDPHDAVETGYISVGHGDPECTDRLNILLFRIPVLNNEMPRAGTDRLVLLFDSSVASAEEPGYYIENGRIMQDCLEDFACFFYPIRDALVARLRAEH
jgi:hypothetical protein